MSDPAPPRRGPPPLAPFDLVLHHDGSWTHEGQPIRNRRLREAFDRGVRYLPEEGKFVVTLGRFRGEIVVEEAAFFVRSVDLARGTVALSDHSEGPLRLDTLSLSERDGALLCRVKPELREGGVLARFSHAAQAELLAAVVEGEGGGWAVELAGERVPLPGGLA